MEPKDTAELAELQKKFVEQTKALSREKEKREDLISRVFSGELVTTEIKDAFDTATIKMYQAAIEIESHNSRMMIQIDEYYDKKKELQASLREFIKEQEKNIKKRLEGIKEKIRGAIKS